MFLTIHYLFCFRKVARCLKNLLRAFQVKDMNGSSYTSRCHLPDLACASKDHAYHVKQIHVDIYKVKLHIQIGNESYKQNQFFKSVNNNCLNGKVYDLESLILKNIWVKTLIFFSLSALSHILFHA